MLTAEQLTPPVGDIDAWLLEVEDHVVELLSRFMRDHVPGAVQSMLNALTAAIDPAPFDPLQQQWSELIVNDVGDVLGGVHQAGALSAWVQIPSAQLPPLDFGAGWAKVVNLEAVDYQRSATNRIVGASTGLWADVRAKTVTAIQTGVTNEDLTHVVEAITGYSEQRANTIARTETVAAYNGGNYTGAQALGEYGPAEKWWLAAEDARTRPSHNAADGQVVAFAQPFMVGGVPMTRPHDPAAPAREVVNCRCVMNVLYPGDTRPDGSQVGDPLPDLAPVEPAAVLVEPRSLPEAMSWWNEQAAAHSAAPSDLVEDARKRYIGGSHQQINKALRDGDSPDWLADEVRLLDQAVDDGVTVPGDIQLFRGAHVKGVKAGDVIDDPAYGSFSVNEYTSRGFAGFDDDSVLFRVVDRDDDTPFALGSAFENELIGPRGLKMDVLDVTDNPLGGKIANVRLRRFDEPGPDVDVMGRDDALDWWRAAKRGADDPPDVAQVSRALQSGELPDLDRIRDLDAAVANGIKVPDNVVLYRPARIPDLDVGDDIIDPGYLRLTVDEFDTHGYGPDGDSANVLLRVSDRDPDLRFVPGDDFELIGKRDTTMNVLDVVSCTVAVTAADFDLTPDMPGCPPGGKSAKVSTAGRVKFTDDDVKQWMQARLANSGGQQPSAAALLKEWKSLGRAANDVRWRRLYREVTGDAPRPAPPLGRLADVPEVPGPHSPVVAATRVSKMPDDAFKFFTGAGGGGPGAIKANIATRIAKRLDDRFKPRKGQAINQFDEVFDPTDEFQVWTFTGYDRVVRDLDASRRLRDAYRLSASSGDMAWEQIKDEARSVGYKIYRASDPDFARAVQEMRVADLVHQWAITSNDANAKSLAIQRAAIDEFDLDPGDLADWDVSRYGPELTNEIDRLYADQGEDLRAFVRAQYDETQAEFKAMGVTHVDVYRGMAFHSGDRPEWVKEMGRAVQAGAKGVETDVKLRPLSSFTFDRNVAKRFSGDVILQSRVPVERIVGTARTGVGCFHEREFVVLGGKTRTFATPPNRGQVPAFMFGG